MQNDPKKKIKLKSTPFFGANQSANAKSHDGSLSISLFRTATKILLSFISRAAWQHRYYNTKVGHIWRKYVLKGYTPFYFNFFYICICNGVRSVSFSNGGLRDCDIIFRDETDLAHVFCFFSCLVKFPAREANSWRRRASPNPGNWVCVFFSCFPHPTALAFFHDQTHTLTQTRKVRRHAERPKGDREQFASLDFWITD